MSNLGMTSDIVDYTTLNQGQDAPRAPLPVHPIRPGQAYRQTPVEAYNAAFFRFPAETYPQPEPHYARAVPPPAPASVSVPAAASVDANAIRRFRFRFAFENHPLFTDPNYQRPAEPEPLQGLRDVRLPPLQEGAPPSGPWTTPSPWNDGQPRTHYRGSDPRRPGERVSLFEADDAAETGRSSPHDSMFGSDQDTASESEDDSDSSSEDDSLDSFCSDVDNDHHRELREMFARDLEDAFLAFWNDQTAPEPSATFSEDDFD